MGASSGSRISSSRRSRNGKRKLESQINVVPYIDVMLVLLIICMVTTPLLKQGVKVDLPSAHAHKLKTKNLNTNLSHFLYYHLVKKSYLIDFQIET